MSAGHDHILSSPLAYLKGVGPQRAELLQKELGLFTFNDLLGHYPYRYIDKTAITPIAELHPDMDFALVAGTLVSIESVGSQRQRRLVGELRDSSGSLELVWFQGLNWIQKTLKPGTPYQVYGRISMFNGNLQISHPEMEAQGPESGPRALLEPVYPSTEKLKARSLGGRQLARLSAALLAMLSEKDIPEFLPADILRQLDLPNRYMALNHIHFPPNPALLQRAVKRLKFEELFIAQLRMQQVRARRHRHSKGFLFSRVGPLFHAFYETALPFELTNAQKRVVREIRQDMGSGRQMNRLLQGDVGSGKTIVALLCMLIAADNGFQSCLMAPTEILARQHYENMSRLLEGLPIDIRLLSGNVKGTARRKLLDDLQEGRVQLLTGTHALIEESVRFRNLGLAVVDEQHRFGVAQRARLWEKSESPPHILVMTATPIPRTLAMTAYGDLDYSVIDELPPNRQAIQTVHRLDSARSQVMEFIRQEIARGRQAYIIFPLIEESEKLDYENLQRGYEQIKAWFPEPRYYISMVHGRQPPEQREINMQRFRQNDTQIMVATTVIEVGVDVPNASVMVIESAERFGLSQLHQLRGRVGRGSSKSFCILLTGPRLSREARERMEIMTATNDGFRIAEKDLELRGPGDIGGTRQSGALQLKLSDLIADRLLLELAGNLAGRILEKDPELEDPSHRGLRNYLHMITGKTPWSRIS